MFKLDRRTLNKLKGKKWIDRPKTPHERFYYMVEKNEKLLKLKEELDLEIDI